MLGGGDASQDIDLQLSLITPGQILPSACCMLETRTYPISRIHPVDLHCTAVPTKYNSYWTQVPNKKYLLTLLHRANIWQIELSNLISILWPLPWIFKLVLHQSNYPELFKSYLKFKKYFTICQNIFSLYNYRSFPGAITFISKLKANSDSIVRWFWLNIVKFWLFNLFRDKLW